MSLAVACTLPLVMLAMLFLLARIEERHLKARPIAVAGPAPAEAENGSTPELN